MPHPPRDVGSKTPGAAATGLAKPIPVPQSLIPAYEYAVVKPSCGTAGIYPVERIVAGDDDASIVRRCLRGDPAATRELISRFEAAVFGLCFKMLGDRHDAEDVTQEVFLRIFRSLKRWDAARPLKPWITTIAVNRCRTYAGRRANRPQLVEYLTDTVEAKPPDDSVELRRELTAALENVRPEYRTAFVLFHEQGCSYEEIAGKLDRPVGTIKTWLHRTRIELLDWLRGKGIVEADPGVSDE